MRNLVGGNPEFNPQDSLTDPPACFLGRKALCDHLITFKSKKWHPCTDKRIFAPAKESQLVILGSFIRYYVGNSDKIKFKSRPAFRHCHTFWAHTII